MKAMQSLGFLPAGSWEPPSTGGSWHPWAGCACGGSTCDTCAGVSCGKCSTRTVGPFALLSLSDYDGDLMSSVRHPVAAGGSLVAPQSAGRAADWSDGQGRMMRCPGSTAVGQGAFDCFYFGPTLTEGQARAQCIEKIKKAIRSMYDGLECAGCSLPDQLGAQCDRQIHMPGAAWNMLHCNSGGGTRAGFAWAKCKGLSVNSWMTCRCPTVPEDS